MTDQKAKRHLPARMRQKKTSSGRVYYYYDTGGKPRRWLPLGRDFLIALKRYADYEIEYNAAAMSERLTAAATFKRAADRYVRDIIPGKSIRTQQDNLRELRHLLDYFDNPPAPLDAIRPAHIAEYLKIRGAPVRANREIALFSHIFNKAREWDMTAAENPCRGVAKNAESPRDIYIDDDLFWTLYDAAERHLQVIMLTAYLIGQRVSDCLKIKITDIVNGELWIKQNKTAARVRIRLDGTLGDIIAAVRAEREAVPGVTHDALFVLDSPRHRGQPITYNMLRGAMDRARERAGIDKALFQFRDLRAKAATDKDEAIGIEAARSLLGHKKQSMTSDYIRHRKGKLVTPTIDRFSADKKRGT